MFDADWIIIAAIRLQVNGKKVYPNKLQQIELKVIDQAECRREHKFPITASHVCTLLKAGAGLCFVSIRETSLNNRKDTLNES